MEDYILVIDNGTQSIRALVFDPQGNLIAKVKQKIEAYYSIKPGWAEQDPNYFWEVVCQVCQALWQDFSINATQIKGVAVTSQRATMINVDADGKPLRPAISWLDQRQTENVPPVAKYWRLLFKLIGMDATIRYFQAQAEINWIQRYQPEIWKNTYKYLTLGGYLNYKFTGKFVDSSANQVGYLPFDFKHARWEKSWGWKWQALAIDKNMLPELVAPCEIIGNITSIAAEKTGLIKGTPIIAAAGDKSCEALGTGCLTPDTACLSLGSSASVSITQKKYIEAIRFVPAFPAAIPQMYNIEYNVYRGFWMVEWFKQQFGLSETLAAENLQKIPEQLFEELLKNTPPGAEGLILQPYWSPGIRIPGLEAKGSVIGFSAEHTRAHLYRALIEGLGYALLGVCRT